MRVASLSPGGGFSHDREFALFDESGYVNGKREPMVHALRVRYDASLSRADFMSTQSGDGFRFAFDDAPGALEAWLARQFGRPITVRRDPHGGFPDDTAAPGPTVISSATLAAVAAWFGDLDAADVGLRLRTNIEVGDVAPFWEDRLYAQAGTAVPFSVGETMLEGTNPCARCIVPARDPETGTPIPGFAKRVAARRAASLPPWAEAARFDHFYRLAVNTRAAPEQTGHTIRVGDVVTLRGRAT